MDTKKKPNLFSTIEMCVLLISIGISFAILGLLHISGKITITSSLVSAIAISGLLFVIADFFNFPLKLLENEKPTVIKKNSKFLFNFIRIILLIASILALIILPYVLKPSDILDKIAIGLSIVAIGFTIINISLNYYLQSSEMVKYFISQNEKAIALAEEYSDYAKRAIVLAEESGKRTERAIIIAENLTEKNKE